MSGLERSKSTNLFASARHAGIQLHGNLGMFTCGIGVFKGERYISRIADEEVINGRGSSKTAVVDRLTAAPISEYGKVLPLGAGFIETGNSSEFDKFWLKDAYNLEAAAVADQFHF